MANENIPLASVKKLQSLHDTKSVMLERSGIKDIEVLEWANSEQRIILTFDRDYGELIYKHKLPAPQGLIYFRFEPQHPLEAANILISIIEADTIAFTGKYSVIERDKIRQRELK